MQSSSEDCTKYSYRCSTINEKVNLRRAWQSGNFEELQVTGYHSKTRQLFLSDSCLFWGSFGICLMGEEFLELGFILHEVLSGHLHNGLHILDLEAKQIWHLQCSFFFCFRRRNGNMEYRSREKQLSFLAELRNLYFEQSSFFKRNDFTCQWARLGQ